MTRKQPRPPVTVLRCGVYTRKSTEDGLDQEFNSLDAQRESGEAYIASQKHEGWVCVPEHYDDGGYTGGNMDRPAVKRLLADIAAGKIDIVVVYKVDRLSRSLMDFARMMETFEKHGVSFVSVTQQFNTATSMGRLVLNVLLSFAQFEREMISERTRDKIAATRRKGKWAGGMPILGYDVVDTKLVVNRPEANSVRQIFALYLENQSLIRTVRELNERIWRTKQWTTKKGKRRGGKPFTKNALYQLLTNVAYAGKVRYKKEVHNGEHEAIVDEDMFRRVQATLHKNGRSGGSAVRNKHGALLRGVLRCATCDRAMAHTYTAKGQRNYRYYVCTQAQQRGWHACPSPSVPAGEIERFVLDQIKCIGRDPALVAETLAEIGRLAAEQQDRLEGERKALTRQLRDHGAELRRLAARAGDGERTAALADVQERIRAAEQRLTQVNEEFVALADEAVDKRQVTAALADFDAVWDALAPREQTRVLELLIDQVAYDGKRGNISITFRPTGLKALAAGQYKEDAA